MPEKAIGRLQICAIVLFYITISVSMVIINRILLFHTQTPLLLLWSQLVIGAVSLKAACFLTFIPSLSFESLVRFAPLISVNVIGLALNTMCLYYLDAMIYQICRALVLPITGLLTPFVTGKMLDWKIYASCLIIVAGFTFGVYGERLNAGSVSYLGMIFGILSSITTSIQTFIIQRSLRRYKKQGPFEVVYLSNAYSAIFLPLFFVVEFQSIAELFHSKSNIYNFLKAAMISGIIGILINLATFLQIEHTSPLSHTVSSAAKGVFQTLLAYLILGEALTSTRISGIAITLFGSILYSIFKMQNARPKNPAQNNSPTE